LEDPNSEKEATSTDKDKKIDEETIKDETTNFNLRDNQLELDRSFCNNLFAVVKKRLHNYKRNRKAVFNEMILPALIMVAGFILAMRS
jgi:glucan phosphorylase